jgi:hypothetical protein
MPFQIQQLTLTAFRSERRNMFAAVNFDNSGAYVVRMRRIMTLLAIGAAALLLTVSIVLFAGFIGAGLADGSD